MRFRDPFRRGLRSAAIVLGAGLMLVDSTVRAEVDPLRVSRDEACRIAALHLRCSPDDVTLATFDPDCRPRRAATWVIDVRQADGVLATVYVDSGTGHVWGWRRFPAHQSQTGMDDPTPEPKVTLSAAREIALAYAREAGVDLSNPLWRPTLATDQRGQFNYVFGWDPVLDSASGALGPIDLRVEVDFQTGEVTGFYEPWPGPIVVTTRPSLPRSAIAAIARRFAILDPNLHPVNRIDLRVAMDRFGAQRLVWECHQVVEDRGADGVLCYTVVYDAHTGEPLYCSVPMAPSNYPQRKIDLPRRVSIVVEPGGRALATALAPPVVDSSGLWVRAEHLRAVEGVRVEVGRQGVSVGCGKLVLSEKVLGARYRDYGWWVPLRHAAKLLGWRTEWLPAKQEAVVYTK